MTDNPDHVKVYDPNAPSPQEPAPPVAPVRTPSIVLGEFMRALVSHLGNHPKLDALLTEFEEMTKAPEIPADPEKKPEPEF
jgi:hypothetical protein